MKKDPKKPVKKERPSDPNMRMRSIMDDIVEISEKPVESPKKRKTKEK